MDTTDYTPETCRHSSNSMGVYICRMATLPCPYLYGDGQCAKEKSDKAMKNIAEAIKAIREEIE